MTKASNFWYILGVGGIDFSHFGGGGSVSEQGHLHKKDHMSISYEEILRRVAL